MSIKERAQNGDAFKDILIIDSHAHWGGYSWTRSLEEAGCGGGGGVGDADTIIKDIEKIGVDKLCLSSIISIYSDFEYGNLEVERAVKAYPDKFFGLYVANPHYPEVYDQIPEWMDKTGFIGIKIHPIDQRVGPLNGKIYEPIWEIASKKKVMVQSHTWYPNLYCDPMMFGDVAESYPEVPIILCHSGGSIEGYVRSVEVAQDHNNIFLETDNKDFHFRGIEFLVESVGPSRILYGSDYVTETISAQIGPILYARISDDEKKMILGENMKKLLEKINRY